MHCYPGERVGWIGVREGPFFASADRFEVRVFGEGGHAACPHETKDSVVIASHVMLALQTVVSREVDPLFPCVVSVCEMRGGTANNIIPNEVVLSGTVRTFSEDVLERVTDEMERKVKSVAAAYGGRAEWIYERKYPVLVNSEEETRFAEDVAVSFLGRENVERAKPTMGGEDFAFMLEEKPGSYIVLGNGERGEKGGEPVHSPRFDFNDDALLVGSGYWVNLVEKLLPLS
jgi:hippurate hydrolase